MIAGAIALFLSAKGARWLALIATIVDLDIGLYLWANYDPTARNGSSSRSYPISGLFGWNLGIDGIALVLIMLSVFLMPICIGASWRAISGACPNTWPPSCSWKR